MPASDPFPVLCLLQSHLEALAGRGQRRLWLSGEARQALREIVKMKPRPWTPEMVQAAAEAETTAEATVRVAAFDEQAGTGASLESESLPVSGDAGVGSAPGMGTEAAVLKTEPSSAAARVTDEIYEPEPAPQAVLREEAAGDGDGWDDQPDGPDSIISDTGSATSASSVSPEIPPAPLTLEEKEARLAAVRERAEEGRVARALGTLRDRMVFAVGRADAEIVLVGEAPGAEEERMGEPFVGPAGQLLNRILNAMGLQRADVYISNICKFRPEMENQGSRNRQPSALEMDSCMDFVREEIRIIRPKVIVALGATASAGLLGIKSGVMSARGRFYEFEGIPAMVTLHPSYLLHREKDGPEIANAEKRKVWEDMLQVMERAGLPVSDKQRRYFLPK